MPCRDAYRASAPFAKLVSLSVMMLLGTPYLQTKSATKRTAVGPSSFLIGRASIHLVNLSTATRRCVMPLLALLLQSSSQNHIAEWCEQTAFQEYCAVCMVHPACPRTCTWAST